jgi:hypothetical protein
MRLSSFWNVNFYVTSSHSHETVVRPAPLSFIGLQMWSALSSLVKVGQIRRKLPSGLLGGTIRGNGGSGASTDVGAARALTRNSAS